MNERIFRDFPELKTVDTREIGSDRTIKSYVLRTAGLKEREARAIERYWPRYGLSFKDEPLDLPALFGNDKPVVVEIGFGMGAATAHIARTRGGYNYLGLEVFLTGIAKLLNIVGKEDLDNIRIMRFDAVEVLKHMIVDGSIAGFHIFFPDPWPKKRHVKRRLIQKPFAELLARKLVKGGYIYCVTDWQEYAEQMLDVFDSIPGLKNPHRGFAPPIPWRLETSFERKGVAKEHPINEVWVEKL
ncbi:MAG: tRNA (guanosine(46)-N7)-methyltransferase TrmB [Spirochaetales bacterium]|nr:tRNA (guanosine(46)-N7)-methyltransferase TrmB [Spirochaetales bacterium]